MIEGIAKHTINAKCYPSTGRTEVKYVCFTADITKILDNDGGNCKTYKYCLM